MVRALGKGAGVTLAVLCSVAYGCSSPDSGTPGAIGGTGTAGAGAGGAASGAGGAGAELGGSTPGGSGGSATGGSGAGAMGGTSAGSAGSAAGGTSGSTAGGMAGAAAGAGGSTMGGGAGSAGSGTSGSGGSSAGSGGAMPTAGCGKAAPASDRYTIDVDGTMREYILDVPSGYDPNRPYRLIFGWHPLGGSAQQVASGSYYGLEGQADGSAIFVAAEGLPFQGTSLGWANTNGRDIAFLEAMLARFRSELCIDESRIFSTGFSFGGMMSFAVGCALGGVMRAIAPMAGNIQVSGCENGSAPVAVMGFHGDHDSVVSIDGGRAGRDVFVERNGCMDSTMPTTPSWCDGLSQNNQPCSCVSYQGCTAGYPVIWCEFNADHTPAPSSAATIWNFFSQF